MGYRFILLGWFVFIVVWGLEGAIHGQDWPQWLGPKRDGVWRESGILKSFPDDGPPLRWTAKLGSGYSGPAVADGRVYVMDRIAADVDADAAVVTNKDQKPLNANFERKDLPGSERVVCLRESDGSILWVHEYDCPYSTVATYAIGPRVTPCVEADRVYALGAEGDLLCLRTTDGGVVWSRDFKRDYSLAIPYWGVSAHPLIDGNRLICMVGGKGTTVVAFDKMTGRELWRALDAAEPGYCPPVIHTIGGKRQLIVWHSDAISGLDPATGKVYWSQPLKPTFAMAIGTPRLSGRRLFVMSFSRQSHLIQIAEDGLSASIDWKGDTRVGIGGVMNTPFIVGDHIYGCGRDGRYACVRLDTGERVWTSYGPTAHGKRGSWANVFTVQHEDRFFLANDIGELILARLSPEGYEEISRATLIEPTHQVGSRTLVWSHPAFANRSVYLRNDKEIRCYSLADTEAE